MRGRGEYGRCRVVGRDFRICWDLNVACRLFGRKKKQGSVTVCISTDVCIEIKGEKGLGRVRRLMGWDGGLCLAAKGCWLMFGSLGIGLKKWDWKF
ncbi:hypothetical protein KY290_037283 [Solanum tuberosum]|uniref:Uncharacterized protein n=1 Tax=Solanum tuberosum TaxID=4113 RepID=A0ABQ7TWJ6_SOLTU|nr:hypothetical protein KY285_036580 [Solanum tuberosum]KAH0738578.1 hypothetical protein KY290_037283 [Solanum tuberosum]